MKQLLNVLARWVLAVVLAGLHSAAIAQVQVRSHGFLYANGAFTIIDVPGASYTFANGINNTGQIVGSFEKNGVHGFIETRGTFSTIDVPGVSAPGGRRVSTVATGINDAGHIVGFFDNINGVYGFLDADGVFSTIQPGAPFTNLGDINNTGRIVGTTSSHGFLYDNGAFTNIDFPGASFTQVSGINDVGHIVGTSQDEEYRGFVYANGTFTNIDVPGAIATLAYGINDAGQIVGTFGDAKGGLHGFLDSDGTFSTIDFPGAFQTNPIGINDAGQIVGSADFLVAVPEPDSAILFSVGLLGLGLAWRYRSGVR